MSCEGDTKFRRGNRERKNVKIDRVRYPFWFGGSASCFAACVTHPLDLVKVRLPNANLQWPLSREQCSSQNAGQTSDRL
ncbi:MAG: Mitochondrial dicarboxylate transporter [Geoglossum simile]|nr:MAG: Mitochondrial dicarboxylate transporter [Geoglossum simile]